MSDYRYSAISALREALVSKRASPGELAAEAISLISTVGAEHNAVANVLPARAERDAAAAERILGSGDAPPLCGIPYAVKDLFAVTGAPTTFGSPMFETQVLDRDATVVRRLTAQGAVLTAKLAMSELAGGGHPSRGGASLHGQGRNPWDPQRYSGGSSSGSGIAVALGLVPFALGTETGGSVVGPAAFMGITGLRPTFGLVPRQGVMTLSWTLDKVGTLARSAADCAAVMDAMTRVGGFEQAIERLSGDRLTTTRVAFSDSEIAEAAPSIRGALRIGVRDFRRLFPQFVSAEIERDTSYITALEEIVRVEGAFEFRQELDRPDFRMTDERQQRTLAEGLRVSARDYLYALRVARARARRAFYNVFKHADVILSASRPTVAPLLDAPRLPRDASKMSDLLRAAGNLVGLPGVSIPCGLSDEGMPVGLHLLGPRGSDSFLLAVAARFQRATTHHLLRPPVKEKRL